VVGEKRERGEIASSLVGQREKAAAEWIPNLSSTRNVMANGTSPTPKWLLPVSPALQG